MQKGEGDLPPSVERADVIIDTELRQQGVQEGSGERDLLRETGTISSTRQSAPKVSGMTPEESLSKAIPRVFTAISARDLDQVDHMMVEYDGKVKLITNVASLCKTTDTNYEELMQLYDRFFPQGFEILGFPCRQFKEQEYRDPEEIKAFIANYNVSFPVFDLTIVNGPNTHPVFLYCKYHSEELYSKDGLLDIEWNFGKFLLDRDNRVYKYYRPQVNPMTMIDDIRKLLSGKLQGSDRGPDGRRVEPLPSTVEDPGWSAES